MKISEIVSHAACNSGVVPSFNLNDIPGDYYELGSHKLVYEVLPLMNVDRTLDMAQTSVVKTPINGFIEFKVDPSEIPSPVTLNVNGVMTDDASNDIVVPTHYTTGASILGKLPYISQKLDRFAWSVEYSESPRSQRPIYNYLLQAGIIDKVATDNLHLQDFTWVNETKQPVFVTTQDDYLLQVVIRKASNGQVWIYAYLFDTNLRFMPYFIDSVIDEPSGLPHAFRDIGDFHSLDSKFTPFIYTQENGDDWLRIEFRTFGATPKRITMPIPIYLAGDEIVAPPKFNNYLIDSLAEQYAIMFNMATLPNIQNQRKQSYGVLKRQNPRVIQEPNVRVNIRNVVRNGSWRTWGFNVFGGR